MTKIIYIERTQKYNANILNYASFVLKKNVETNKLSFSMNVHFLSANDNNDSFFHFIPQDLHDFLFTKINASTL